MLRTAARRPEDLIIEGAGRLGVELRPDQVGALQSYLSEVLRWSEKMSLTALDTPEAVIREGILDSLSCSPLLPPDAKQVVDIGSGAGFPAIPLSISQRGTRFLLIESVRKKTTFLRHVVRRLGLENAEVWHGRAESFSDATRLGIFDAAFARAAAPLKRQAALVFPFLRTGGVFIAQTSRQAATTELGHIDSSAFELCGRIATPEWIAGSGREICVLRRR